MSRDIAPDKAFQLLLIVALLSFVPFLGSVHLFDWDEINFAESAREMIVSQDYFHVKINFEQFWEKPPLFFWLQAGAMHVFGVGEFAARLPNAIFGLLTLYMLYRIGKRERSERFGIIAAALYFCSFLPHFYFRSGIIDPVFNFFIFLSSYFLYKGLTDEQSKSSNALWSGAFAGLAVLTKGPVGFLLVFLAFLAFISVKKFRMLPSLKQVALFALSCAFVSFFWFGFEVVQNGPWFLVEFISYQIDLFSKPVAGHKQPIYYHFVVVLLGTFPASIFGLPLILRRKRQTPLNIYMLCLFWTVMVLFTIVTTKIVHYSSMAYLPLTILAAAYLEDVKAWSFNSRFIRFGYIFLGTVFALLFGLVPLVGIYNDELDFLFRDSFSMASFLNPAIVWHGFEPLIGIIGAIGFWVHIHFWQKGLLIRGLLYSGAVFGLSMTLLLTQTVSKIEGYTQRPLIGFFKDLSGKPVYVATIGFKSYAPYFYFEQPETPNPVSDFKAQTNSQLKGSELQDQVKNWLVAGEISRPAYLVTKINKTYLDNRSDIRFLYAEGGYKFFYRPASETAKTD